MVVEGLEVVEVGVQQREGSSLIDLTVDLLLDANVAGQSGQRRLRPHVARAAEHAADPREELGSVEGLDDVVVRPDREPLELVGGQAPGGEHDDRHGGGPGVLPKPAGQLESVHVRHHDVGQHQVGTPFLGGREGERAVARDPDVVSGGAQLDLEQTGDEGVVVDHEQALAAPRVGLKLLVAHASPCRFATHPSVSVPWNRHFTPRGVAPREPSPTSGVPRPDGARTA